MQNLVRKVSTWGVAVCLLGGAPEAVAQTDQERAAARSAAKEGISAYHEQNFEEALRYLRNAESVIHAPTHLLFIARSQVGLGQFVEALETYQKIAVEKLPSNAPQAFVEAREAAVAEMPSVEERIGKLVLKVSASDGSNLQNLVVTLNGANLPPALVGTPTPVNPGKVKVSIAAHRMQLFESEIDVGEGKKEKLVVSLKPGKADPSEATMTAPDAAEPGTEPRAAGRSTAGWAFVVSGGAVFGTGAVLGAFSLKQLGNARSDDTLCGRDDQCTKAGWDKVESARLMSIVGDISMGVGLAATGVGIYLLATSGKRTESVTGVRHVVPSADRHGGYVTVGGAF
jgi:hypothetical protein